MVVKDIKNQNTAVCTEDMPWERTINQNKIESTVSSSHG